MGVTEARINEAYDDRPEGMEFNGLKKVLVWVDDVNC